MLLANLCWQGRCRKAEINFKYFFKKVNCNYFSTNIEKFRFMEKGIVKLLGKSKTGQKTSFARLSYPDINKAPSKKFMCRYRLIPCQCTGWAFPSMVQGHNIMTTRFLLHTAGQLISLWGLGVALLLFPILLHTQKHTWYIYSILLVWKITWRSPPMIILWSILRTLFQSNSNSSFTQAKAPKKKTRKQKTNKC